MSITKTRLFGTKADYSPACTCVASTPFYASLGSHNVQQRLLPISFEALLFEITFCILFLIVFFFFFETSTHNKRSEVYCLFWSKCSLL